jgi:hypothetical protein
MLNAKTTSDGMMEALPRFEELSDPGRRILQWIRSISSREGAGPVRAAIDKAELERRLLEGEPIALRKALAQILSRFRARPDFHDLFDQEDGDE